MKKNNEYRWEIKSWEELTKEDLYALGKLRIAVFVVEQDCPYQDFDGNDDQSDHLLAWDNQGYLVAYARIVFPGVTYPEVSIGRVVVDEATRGKSIGNQLMKRSIEFVKQKYGTVSIHISAQEHLEKFYSELGFCKVTAMYLEDDIPHIGMDLKI